MHKIRVVLVLVSLALSTSKVIVISGKTYLIRNLYWGRTSFYKGLFHVGIIVTTTMALYSGLGSRLISTQVNADRYKDFRVSESTRVDSDIIYQQGALFPLEDLGEGDGVYFNYTVKGITDLSKIAKENKVNLNTLRWANEIPGHITHTKTGLILKIPVMNGILYKVKSGDTINSILSKVVGEDLGPTAFQDINYKAFTKDGKLIVNSLVLIPDASLPTGNNKPNSPIYNPPPGLKGNFVNPMQLCAYRISQGYWFQHKGVDLASNTGCWIVAAGGGIVSKAGRCEYRIGNCVVIKHAGGFQTLYGHGNGVFAVKPGDIVQAGEKIMQVGESGKAKGPHLHLSLSARNQDVFGCFPCRINPAGIIPY